MTEIALKNPASFGQKIAELYLEQGFQSLPKRDLDLLFFILLEIDGAIGKGDNSYDVARKLRITEERVKSLRKYAYARWRTLIEETPQEALKRIISRILTVENIKAGAVHASEKKREDGFLSVMIEHPDDRAEFEHAIKALGAIPVYERNTEVIDVRFDTLIEIAEKNNFFDTNPKAIRDALKGIEPSAEALDELLKTPISRLKWRDVRSALNALGADAIKSLATSKLESLLKIVFPFMK